MKRRLLTQSIILVFFTVINFSFTKDGISQAQTQFPNILLIVADDLGYEKVGCYSGLQSLTPNLDKLAKNGTMFTRAYASPVCTPSRMSLYTGTYATTHKYTRVLPVHTGGKEYVDFTKWTTYAQLLRTNGYHTAVTGKWQMAALEFYPQHCSSAGFDSWCVWQIWRNNKKTKRYWNATFNEDGTIRSDIDSLFGPDVLTDYVIQQMKLAKEKGKPFCIQHNMLLPHVPIIATPDDKLAKRQPSLDTMIKYLDKQIEILLNAIQELEIANNTIVIFIGDNGTQSDVLRETKKGMVSGGKWTLTDGGMHVPLIMYNPNKIPMNNKVHDLIDIADLFPTICDLTNTEINENINIDGVSFYNTLMGGDNSKRKFITGGYQDEFALFDGNWRLHYFENKLIDCRNLPKEKDADMGKGKGKKAYSKLKPILENLLKDDNH